MVKKLLDLKREGYKFPIENPYISFLYHYENAIEKNPNTVQKICSKLFELSFDELKDRLETPKKASRRIGPMFKNWLSKNFKFCKDESFLQSKNETVFLTGSDKKLKEFAILKLKCFFNQPSKGLDFVAKIGSGKYLIGTAKFITDFGGSQDNQFYEAIRLLKETKCPNNVIKVAIIDGVCWLRGKMKKDLERLNENEHCFSVLYLKEFLSKLQI